MGDIFVYAAEKDSTFRGACMPDAKLLRELMLGAAEYGWTVRAFKTRAEYLAWLDALKANQAEARTLTARAR